MIRQCLLCEKGTDEGDLQEVSTYDVDASLRTMMNELQDKQLLARIVGGDLIAMDVEHLLNSLVILKCQLVLGLSYSSHLSYTHCKQIIWKS